MRLIRGLRNLRESHRGSVVTVGTYDGIHLGHEALLQRLRDHGRRLKRPTMMLTFEPMPREHLAPADPPPRLMSWRERWRMLSRTSLDYLWLLRFCENVRGMPGEKFAQLLFRDLRAPVVVVGHDFRFGRNGEASAAMLQQAGSHLGCQVDVVPPVTIDGVRVSSSRIRDALARGDLQQAARWLGRAYSMRGRVIEGRHLGRELGFATANLRLDRRRAALAGIFAVNVLGVRSAPMPGVASLGTRPTVNGSEPLLEAHLFDFEGDLYGREIEVEFVAKLRDEQRFESLEVMVEQMHRDASEARELLGREPVRMPQIPSAASAFEPKSR
ncbi:MAG TPA: bifunctional riboflavin kinase/FAD synthetase [Steroidobacteraceae bacterium]|nr:bifunctional riboflavin kinase/FAD synthetase [Steroidobacteraceae bacterium]